MSIGKEVGVKGLLGYKLKKTQHALRLQMDEALRALDLTTPQYAVLAQLELKPGRLMRHWQDQPLSRPKLCMALSLMQKREGL